MRPSLSRAGAAWVLLACGALAPCVVLALHSSPLRQFRTVEAALLVLGAVMGLALIAVWRDFVPTRRSAMLVILGVALVARMAFVGHAPSNDVHRYLWEGRVQHHGVNPYASAPADPSLAHLRDADHAKINHPEWTAIYGPAAEALFAVVAFFSPPATAWKLTVLLFDLAAIALLIALLRSRGTSTLWVVGYAWNPLVLWSFAGQAHLDAVVTVAILAALLALERGRAVLAGLALGLGLLVKATLVVLLPLLCLPRWRPRALGALMLLVVAGYLPYASAGSGLFGSLIRFGTEKRFNDLPSLIFAGRLGPTGLRVVAVVILALVVAWLWRRRRHAVDVATALLGSSMLVLPTVQPWYGAPLAACNCATRSAAWWVLTVSLVVALETAAREVATGEWNEPGWVRWVTYGPFLIVAVAEAAWRDRHPR